MDRPAVPPQADAGDVEIPAFHFRQVKLEDIGLFAKAGLDYLQILFVTMSEDVVKSPYWPEQLMGYLPPFLRYSTSIDTVIPESVKRRLVLMQKEEWQKRWLYPLYREYHRVEYGHFLMKKAMDFLCRNEKKQIPLHVYVLGYEEFVPQIIQPYMRRIRGIICYTAGRQRALEEYVEVLCEEEGLAADCRLLQGEEMSRLRLICEKPAVVLDLTGEEKVIPVKVREPLAWIDMDANEGKRAKIEGRFPKTMYFSMKEEWGILDTMDKNGYNT